MHFLKKSQDLAAVSVETNSSEGLHISEIQFVYETS